MYSDFDFDYECECENEGFPGYEDYLYSEDEGSILTEDCGGWDAPPSDEKAV